MRVQPDQARPLGQLARLQRLLGISVLAVAGLWCWAGLSWNWSWPAIFGGLLVILLPHAPVLAAEFMLLAIVSDPSPAPAPAPSQLLRAWAGEVATGVATFGWRQPWRPHAVPDHLPAGAAGRRGLVLVHGFVCNRGLWTPWLTRLRAADVPFVAVSLEPVFGDIEQYVASVDAAVTRLQALTGRPPLIVCHSMGGLATRAWLRAAAQSEARCAGVVTIGTPHQGTWLARFALSPNGRQMRRGGPWLAALAADEAPERYRRFTCFWGHCDNIVFPAATAMLPGADNRHLAGTAHVDLVHRPEVLAEVMRRLTAAD